MLYVRSMSSHSPLQQLLLNAGIAEMNPLQREAAVTISSARNTWIHAPTGSGKTLAYLLPLLPLLRHEVSNPQAIILSPTRELALQIREVFRSLQSGFATTVFYGGHRMRTELDQLSSPPPVIIGTPGRMADHLQNQRIDVRQINYLVLDEFDKCLELGFQKDMDYILSCLPNLQKRICVSATGTPEIFSLHGFDGYQSVVYTQREEASGLSLYHLPFQPDNRLEILYQLLCALSAEMVFVFCARRDDVDTLHQELLKCGLPNTRFHGALEQADRERAVIRLRQGSARVLVTTDLAARGLDIPEVRHIIHWDMPRNEEDFRHRNGRTARMQASGAAYLMYPIHSSLPDYAADISKPFVLPKSTPPTLPDKETLYIPAGRKQKIRKLDVVGWLLQKGGLQSEELSRVDILDDRAYAAVPREKAIGIIQLLQAEPLKKRRVRVVIARD